MTEPEFLPGTASLVDFVDRRLLVVMRDGRKLIGILRSYDQFANLILQDTIERIYVGNKFGDIINGLYLVRGENIVLLGELNEGSEKAQHLVEVSMEDILEAQREEIETKERQEKIRSKILLERGFDPSGEIECKTKGLPFPGKDDDLPIHGQFRESTLINITYFKAILKIIKGGFFFFMESRERSVNPDDIVQSLGQIAKVCEILATNVAKLNQSIETMLETQRSMESVASTLIAFSTGSTNQNSLSIASNIQQSE